MFSQRLDWQLAPNRLSVLVAEKRASGEVLYDLTASNPTHADLPYSADLLQAFTDERALVYDASANGLLSAREEVARYYAEQHGKHVSPEHVLLTASTSEAYALLFKLLANPGDEVLTPRPSYPLFELLASLESVQVRQYLLRYDHGWFYDFDSLAQVTSARTRAVVVVNPNNPTGSFLKREEHARLAAFCAEHELALIADEVFADYALAPNSERVATTAGTEACLTFSLSGLSKVSGLPQMKLGWIVVSGPDALRRTAYERLEFISDTYLSVSTPVQYAARELLASHRGFQHALKQRLTANRRALDELLAQPGSPLQVLQLEGGWYATVQVPRLRSEEEWTLHLLREHNVLVQPGYFYDFTSEAYLVLSLMTPEPEFREGIHRLHRAIMNSIDVG